MTTMMVRSGFSEWLLGVVTRTEAVLARALPREDIRPKRLHDAMRYAALGGGKRVRASLVYAAGVFVGAPVDGLDAAAAAIEMMHAYSLVHDDLPCMDDDDLRRGKPTVHRAYDEVTALLAGDALQAQAFVLLSEAPLAAAQRIALVHELAKATSSLGMVGGQAIDLVSVGVSLDLAELETMHRMKTGALLLAAVRMGLVCGQGGAIDCLDNYARAIGLAFQVVDDILDVTVQTEVLGKTAGKDAIDNKPTYVSLLGLDAARRLAHDLCEEACAALDLLVGDKRYLRELAQLVVARTH